MLGYALLYVFPFAMIYAAASDLVSMTIPNKLCLLLVVSFFIVAPMIGMDLKTMATNVAIASVVLALCFGGFVAGWMGGGDAKLLPATVLWLGPEYGLLYLVFSGITGGVLTLVLLYFRGQHIPLFLHRVEWIDRLHRSDVGVPYGIALGIGGVFVYQETLFMDQALKLAIL